MYIYIYSESISISESHQTWAKIKHNLFIFIFNLYVFKVFYNTKNLKTELFQEIFKTYLVYNQKKIQLIM